MINVYSAVLLNLAMQGGHKDKDIELLSVQSMQNVLLWKILHSDIYGLSQIEINTD